MALRLSRPTSISVPVAAHLSGPPAKVTIADIKRCARQ